MNRKFYEKQNHYSIRKLSIGAASVLIGTSIWLGGQNINVVRAADNTNDNENKDVASQTEGKVNLVNTKDAEKTIVIKDDQSSDHNNNNKVSQENNTEIIGQQGTQDTNKQNSNTDSAGLTGTQEKVDQKGKANAENTGVTGTKGQNDNLNAKQTENKDTNPVKASDNSTVTGKESQTVKVGTLKGSAVAGQDLGDNKAENGTKVDDNIAESTPTAGEHNGTLDPSRFKAGTKNTPAGWSNAKQGQDYDMVASESHVSFTNWKNVSGDSTKNTNDTAYTNVYHDGFPIQPQIKIDATITNTNYKSGETFLKPGERILVATIQALSNKANHQQSGDEGTDSYIPGLAGGYLNNEPILYKDIFGDDKKLGNQEVGRLYPIYINTPIKNVDGKSATTTNDLEFIFKIDNNAPIPTNTSKATLHFQLRDGAIYFDNVEGSYRQDKEVKNVTYSLVTRDGNKDHVYNLVYGEQPTEIAPNPERNDKDYSQPYLDAGVGVFGMTYYNQKGGDNQYPGFIFNVKSKIGFTGAPTFFWNRGSSNIVDNFTNGKGDLLYTNKGNGYYFLTDTVQHGINPINAGDNRDKDYLLALGTKTGEDFYYSKQSDGSYNVYMRSDKHKIESNADGLEQALQNDYLGAIQLHGDDTAITKVYKANTAFENSQQNMPNLVTLTMQLHFDGTQTIPFTITDLETGKSYTPVHTPNNGSFDWSTYRSTYVKYVDDDENESVIGSADSLTSLDPGNYDKNDQRYTYKVNIPEGYALLKEDQKGNANYQWPADDKTIIYHFNKDNNINTSNPIIIHLRHIIKSSSVGLKVTYKNSDGKTFTGVVPANATQNSTIYYDETAKKYVNGKQITDKDGKEFLVIDHDNSSTPKSSLSLDSVTSPTETNYEVSHIYNNGLEIKEEKNEEKNNDVNITKGSAGQILINGKTLIKDKKGIFEITVVYDPVSKPDSNKPAPKPDNQPTAPTPSGQKTDGDKTPAPQPKPNPTPQQPTEGPTEPVQPTAPVQPTVAPVHPEATPQPTTSAQPISANNVQTVKPHATKIVTPVKKNIKKQAKKNNTSGVKTVAPKSEAVKNNTPRKAVAPSELENVKVGKDNPEIKQLASKNIVSKKLASAVSKQAKAALPQTGENQHSTLAAAVLGAAALTIGLLGLADTKKRRN